MNKPICPRFNCECPQKISRRRKTCFVMLAYKEQFSPQIEKMLKSAVKTALNLTPVLAKYCKSEGSMDFYCTKICKPIQEATSCIVDFTYHNENVGYEMGIAQGFNKPVIVTRYLPEVDKLKSSEKKKLNELKQKGLIQYSKVPCPIPSNITAVDKFEYKNQKELNKQLKQIITVKK